MHPYLDAFIGGIIIGFAGLLYLFGNGRILGVSGIIGGWFDKSTRKEAWRYAFFWGLVAGGLFMRFWEPASLRVKVSASPYLLIAAGLLVGYGTRWGGGCTSGHGICGMSRFSPRSIAATLVFMGVGMLTVLVFRQVMGAR